MLLPILWVTCAAVVVVSAVRVRHHRTTALRTARFAMAALYLVAGAAVNLFFLLRGDDYAEFARGSYLPFVRDTWASLVVPNHDAFISVLIVFEVAVGVLVLLGGRRTQLAYAAAILFHVALLSFGWGFFLWSVPMVAAMVRLLHAERQPSESAADDGDAGADRDRLNASSGPWSLSRADTIG
jgi:uncharacterized membrane protein YphA (DoxX/SURF4 family)